MAIDLEKYQRLKTRSDKAKSDTAKAEGALEEQYKKLKSDFEVDSIEAADEKIEALEEQEQEIETKYNAAMAEFETKFKEKI